MEKERDRPYYRVREREMRDESVRDRDGKEREGRWRKREMQSDG